MVNLKEKLLSGWLGDQFLDEARVQRVVSLGACYRLFELSGDALRRARVEAGDKLQVHVPGAGTRTYTPFAFRPEAGTLQLLVYLPGRGPARAWAERIVQGDTLRYFGPRGSLPLASMAAPVALYGDETSLAVARALFEAHGPRAMAALEVADLASARAAAQHIGLGEEVLVERRAGQADSLARRLANFAGSTGTVVCTGGAQAIQQLRSELRKADRSVTQRTKAYWAEGKVGLD